MKYQHFTLEQRYQISAFKKSGWSNSAIADELARSQIKHWSGTETQPFEGAAIVRNMLREWL